MSGKENSKAPAKKAAIPQLHGIRVTGTANMANPVAMPIGGMTIFCQDVGFFAALSLIAMTAAPAASDTQREAIWDTDREDMRILPYLI